MGSDISENQLATAPLLLKRVLGQPAGVVGLCPDMCSKGYKCKHKILILWCSVVVIDSSRDRDGR